MAGDNFHFDMTGVPLKLALEVATCGRGLGAVAWRVEDNKKLVLYWTASPKSTPLPSKLEGDALEGFVKAWLDNADYGSEPDHDGDNGKGCRVYNESWGQIGLEWQAYVAIEPVWDMYGK